MTFTAAQCLAGRKALGWSAAGLALKARLHPKTVGNFESGVRIPHAATRAALERVLCADGVEFITEDGGGAAVRLRRKAEASGR
jgi:ribosome-binding protein aMBF1 (putative translation factor)